jgi:hypothetical protein
MRRVARTKCHPDVLQVILYQCPDGIYLFYCSSVDDGFAMGDEWYEDLESAESVCLNEYGINSDDWEIIPEPLEYCQHDWIEPVRVIGRDRGKPQWGCLEKLIDGLWKPIELVEGKWVYKI